MHCTSSAESQTGRGRYFTGGTFLDNTEFLYQHPGDVDSRSLYSEGWSEHIENTTNTEDSSINQQTTSDGMSHIRKSYEKRNLSSQSINIIMASWRKTTQKQYSMYINRWVYFCNKRKIDPFQSPIHPFSY
ncbi:hypothetical protein DPMN_129215 [Dreissena polymorpha]|uniref:Uncharacterized protein n=1 Tax=Dreissena polymorpha TaxID=45954 RepID=A0A9D4JY27_DREPO|nr:hypothetical protein DPMN_129215 [Dreissena polymorpha]